MPRIGLLSDSHGRAAVTRQAVRILRDQGAEMLIYLGDVEHEAVLDELLTPAREGGDLLEVHVVFGNCDFDTAGLSRYAVGLGLAVDHPAGRLAFDQGQLAFTHGHLQRFLDQAIQDEVQWLCFGHTHRSCDARKGSTRLINPGALHRAAEYSVALLDTQADAVRFFSVPRG